MTFAKKLAILPLVSLVGIVMIATVLLRDIGSVYRSASVASDNTVPSLLALQRMDSNFIGERLNVWQHVATADPAGMAAAAKQMAARRRAVDEALEEYEPLAVDAKDKMMLADDRRVVADYDSIKEQVIALSLAGRKAEAVNVLMGAKAQLAKSAEALEEHLKYDQALAVSGREAAENTRHSAMTAGVLLTLLTVGLLAALAWAIVRQLTRQLGGEPSDVANVAGRVAQGDFSSRIELRAGDTTSLFAAVGRMQADLAAKLEADQARAAAERVRIETELAAGVDNARIRTALDRVSAGVTLVDGNGTIIYLNDSAAAIFRAHATQIRQLVAQFDGDRIVGSRFDTLHRAASPACPAELPPGYTEELKFDTSTLRIVATPVRGSDGVRVGTVVQWTDRTLEIAVEQEVATMVEKAGNGDLTARVVEEGKEGFFKALAAGMNSLMAGFANVVRSMSQAAGEVRTGADEISRGNLDLSQRTEEQASSLEETAASMEEMTAMVKSNADNAGQANQLASAAREQAERGRVVVGTAVVAMNEINVASKKIADIIGVIDDIAFQTNLLALNAAVEAARAGEQGRGFAVVASEVRSLASRSAAAAREIKSLIQDSVAKVSDGTRLVDESGKVLGEIVIGVKKVSDMMAQIAASSREQASGIDQVNKAVTSIDTVTQQNAALVEQASAAAQTLTDQSATLMGLIVRFRLDAQVGAAAAAIRHSDAQTAAADTVPQKERRSAKRPFSGSVRPKGASSVATTAPESAVGNQDWVEF